MPLHHSASDTWPRTAQPPSYRVQPPTPARGSGVAPALTTPRARRTSNWSGHGTPPPASPLGPSPTVSGASTPRHAHKLSTSSSVHSMRSLYRSSSNGSLRGAGSIPKSGSVGSLSMAAAGRSYSHNSHLGHAQAQGYSLRTHLPSPVTETMEVVDPAELRPSPPSSHLASSGSGEETYSDPERYEHYDSDGEGYDEHVELPCQFYGYAGSDTRYAASSSCACCPPASPSIHGPGYDLVLAPEQAYPTSYSYPTYEEPQKERGMLTGLANRFFNSYILPYLPADLQAIVADPPDLSRPQSLVPLIRAIAPYSQYILVLLAMYIVYAFVSGIVIYMARFVRFCFRIGPVIAIIAWIMAASGQGGIEVIYEALKQYAGLSPTDGGALGRAQARNAHGTGAQGARHHNQYGQYHANPHARTRRTSPRRGAPAPEAQPGPDILSAIFGNPATGQDGLAASVQDYVRAAVARGLGLEWLLGNNEKKDEGKRSRTQTRTR